ncbi:MAG: aldehyde dehydrogenase family protein [Smithellaceae bacterium]
MDTTRAALLLIDFQHDFIQDPLLRPSVSVLSERVALLLAYCRNGKIPVIHIRTLVHEDGRDRMPHWKAKKDFRCVRQTPGAQPPEGFDALPGEKVYEKTYYSAFGNPALNEHLRHAGVKTLLIAGMHTHACIQATVLDAYQLGYTVKLVSDAVASYSPLHADLTMKHLTGRACESVTVAEYFRAPDSSPTVITVDESRIYPVAFIGGQWIDADRHALWEMRDPCLWSQSVGFVPLAEDRDVKQAAALCRRAQFGWAAKDLNDRLEILQTWATALERLRAKLISLIVREVAKPVSLAEAEVDYALGLLRGSLQRPPREAVERLPDDITVQYRPRGVIALITPWNNPLALPVGKLAPALAWGNTVVWKPAMQSPALIRLLIDALTEAGLPADCVNVVSGDANTARALLACPEINAVSFTGSEEAGREISASCGLRQIPLQAELGGNNAAVIAADADIGQAAADLAHATFSFSGQRCTAPRRIVVVEEIFDAFGQAFVSAVRALKTGDPSDPATHVGPLISRDHLDLMRQWVKAALSAGAELLTGGDISPTLTHGCWFEPTLLAGLSLDSPLVQEETFGPLAVLIKARDFDHALAICNGVRQGLRAICYAESVTVLTRFVQSAQAGVLHLNEAATRISVDAPFLGWKSSGDGLPEHGRWDRDFYTLPQAVYGRY